MIPDPEFFALCIRESFQEYLELANQAAGGRPQGAREEAPEAKAKSQGEGQDWPRRAAARPDGSAQTSGAISVRMRRAARSYRPERAVRRERFPVVLRLRQPVRQHPHHAGLNPSPMWLPAPRCSRAVPWSSSSWAACAGHHAVGGRVHAGRRHRRRSLQQPGAHVRQVRDQAPSDGRSNGTAPARGSAPAAGRPRIASGCQRRSPCARIGRAWVA